MKNNKKRIIGFVCTSFDQVAGFSVQSGLNSRPVPFCLDFEQAATFGCFFGLLS